LNSYVLDELERIKKRYGYLKEKELVKLSKKLKIPLIKLYETASFYSFLPTEPKGRYMIRICNNLPCMAKGSEKILKHLEKFLKIIPGETTEDRKFSLETTSCIGCCDKAPAMMINDKIYTNLTEKEAVKIIKKQK